MSFLSAFNVIGNLEFKKFFYTSTEHRNVFNNWVRVVYMS